MIALNSGRFRRTLLLATALGALSVAGPARAQEAAQPGGPVSILPAPPTTEAPPVQEPDIDVGDLAAPSVDRIGVVDTSAGGFPSHLWRGTDIEWLQRVLPQLPKRIASPGTRKLAHDFLLSPGAPPSADTDGALTASQWLLEVRTTTLAATGDWTNVAALLDLVPADQLTETLRRLKAEAGLVTNRIGPTCTQAQAALNATPDPYWQKVQFFCQMNAEESSAAGLGLALLREQRIDDPTFFWAAEVLGGAQPPLPSSVIKLDALHFAMLRKAGATLPANIADVQAKITDPATLGWLAAMPVAEEKADKTPAATKRERRRALEEARILIAERAVAYGTAGPDVLREVYRTINIKDPAPPPLTQITAADARGRALLYQSALAQTVPVARAEVIALALDLVRADRGEKGPDFSVVGHAYASMIGEMVPTADLVWFSGTATRALIAAGMTDKAKAWLDLARNMARSSREAGQIADGLWPLERLIVGGNDPLPPRAVLGWMAALPASMPADVMAARGETLLALLTAAGATPSAADWLPVMGAPPRGDMRYIAPHISNGLELAAKDGRIGEVAALSLVAVGEDSLARSSPSSLQHVIGALRAAGRDDDARALALEAALAFGL
jgi:hypothetical protein